MRHILVNLKRFDIPRELGGVNRLASAADWAATIMSQVIPGLVGYAEHDFVFFLPELHLLGALAARGDATTPVIGCQSVFDQDTAAGGNFGAFTTQRTANAMAAAGVQAALVGHSEERAWLARLLTSYAPGADTTTATNNELNARAAASQAAGLRVVLCIGEKLEERESWRDVLANQLSGGLAGLDESQVLLAYEPIWAIGPGKVPPGREQIQQVAAFVKQQAPGIPLVYGGGLKLDNAAMLASVPELDGGLIALTRFSGEIGFYPTEYLDIVRTYFGEGAGHEA